MTKHAAAPAQPDENNVQGLIHHAFYLLNRIVELLETNSTDTDLAFGGAGMDEHVDNWPTAGGMRLVVQSRQQGVNVAVPAANYQDLLGGDPGRGGLNIGNSGTNSALLFLARAGDAEQGGSAVLYLPAAAQWDGRISGRVWCGPVSVLSALGTSIAVATV